MTTKSDDRQHRLPLILGITTLAAKFRTAFQTGIAEVTVFSSGQLPDFGYENGCAI
nr:MAG TPA: hypothetical protein [Caudoviricetes sp.]